MLAKRHRLRHKADFARLRRRGRRFAHPLVTLIICKQANVLATSNVDASRFAFSASKRVGNAVLRNRAKRMMREAVRLRLEQIPPEWDCLFVARNQTPQASFVEVETAMVSLLKRAKLLSK